MSRQINQPINQVKLTNVAVVRCNKAGKRFEIACYRNKVMDYRSGLEKDLSEVLQAERIFTNVSKGQFAKSADLKKAFGTTDEEAIAKVILEEGKSIQVSDLERNQQIQNALSQIASWVASNCVHPDNGRPYTVSQIKHTLGKSFTVQTHKPLKKQCLDAVKFLKTEIPIERAKMELSIKYDVAHHETVAAAVDRLDKRMVPEKSKVPPLPQGDSQCVMVLQVDPSVYRELDELSQSVDGQLEILQQVVSVEGDVDLDKEIERKKMQSNESKAVTSGNTSLEEATESLKQIDLSPKISDDEKSGGGGDDSDDSDAPTFADRKSQKKASKKAKKAQRRKHHEKIIEIEEEYDDEREPGNDEVAATNNGNDNSSTPAAPPGTKSCNTCGGGFFSAADYRAHFRSDWHRFNQKLKLQGRPPVSEEEFKLCDAETFFGQYDL